MGTDALPSQQQQLLLQRRQRQLQLQLLRWEIILPHRERTLRLLLRTEPIAACASARCAGAELGQVSLTTPHSSVQ